MIVAPTPLCEMDGSVVFSENVKCVTFVYRKELM